MSFPRLRLSGVSAFALLAANIAPCPAYANPQEGTVSAGSASFEQSRSTLTVHQTTDKAVIDWRGFDILHGETTVFEQPSNTSATLNRVNSASASVIDGNLTANGNLFIVNQNGILFGKNAVVDVNGLIATTADIDNERFASGDLAFNKPGNPNAAVVNQGTISAKQSGLVGLVAPNVLNSGVINAKLGRIHLASGDTVTVDLYGDGLMEVRASAALQSQLVENTGKLNAEGGTIAITASAAGETVDSLVRIGGELTASAIGEQSGTIYIYAEGSNAVPNNVTTEKGKRTGASTVLMSGKLDVSGRRPGEHGGTVTVTGDHVSLLNGAIIDASGSDGVSNTTNGKAASSVRTNAAGGNIRIGGDFMGQGTTPTAKDLYVASDVHVYNDALNSGDAGRTIFWSDGATQFFGNMYARAMGTKGGNGGFVETSGREKLDVGGFVNLTAISGTTGLYVMDPTNVTIYGATAPPEDENNSAFSVDYLQQLSQTANIDLQATNNISLDFQGSSLTLEVGRNIALAAGNQISTASIGGITTSGGGNIVFSAANGIVLSNDFGFISGSGNIALSAGQINVNAAATLNGDAVSLTSTVGDININAIASVLGTSSLALTTAGDLAFSLTDTGFAGKLNLASGTSLAINNQAYTIISALGVAGSSTGTDLQGMRGNLSGYYALGNDIDASATSSWNYYAAGGYYYGFQPVGNESTLFNGTLNGLGHSITGLCINRPSTSYTGLFGGISSSAAVRDIAQINATITGNNVVGGLTGTNNGLVTRVYSTGTISGVMSVGGVSGSNRSGATITKSYADVTASGTGNNVGDLVGYNVGTVSDSAADGDATGPNYIGGLVGQNGGTVTNSHATGSATATAQNAGGLVGYNTLTISSSYATGSVNSAGYAGGIVGTNDGSSSSITNSYATGSVTSTARYSGGLVGENYGTVSGSHASATVSGTDSVGGLIGENNKTLSDSYATGNVTGSGMYIGGVVGANYYTASITNTYAETGTISGNAYTGGLVGYSRGNISDSHASTTVSGVTNTGGLVGRVADATTVVTNSYATGNVTGTGDYTGGFAGYNNGTISLGTASGTANGVNYVGGLAGYNANTITESSSTGNASGGDNVGGFVGRNNSSITNSHSSGTAGGANYVGGLAGRNTGTISTAYATGNATASTDSVGGLVGYNTSSVTLSYATGTATGGGHAGGLVGYNYGSSSSVTNSHASGVVSATARYSGGLIGENDGTISTSYATGSVSGTVSTGGLAGENQGTVSSSYATGNVTGTSTYTGGLAGANYLNSSITNSYATGSVTGAAYTGGLVGYSRGNVTDSHATGNVSGTNYVGGLIGIVVETTTVITTSYATGEVSNTSSSYTGGFTGHNNGTISLSYSTGSVNGVNYVGGFAGRNPGTITNSYAIGNASGGNYVSAFIAYNTLNISNSYGAGLVTGTGTTGGLTAYDSAAGSVTSSYWNTTTTGKATSVTGTGLDTAQMMTQSSFSGWDFVSTWSLLAGASYPYLQIQGTPGIIKATSNLASNTGIQVVVNGSIVGTARTASDGTVYAILPQSTVGAGSNILLYNLGGGASAANAVYLAGSNVASGLSLTSSTLWGDSANGMLTNANFATALGSLSSSDIAYTATGNNLAISSAATTLQNSSTGGITINGNITSSGALSLSGPVTLSSNITTTGALSFTGAIALGSNSTLNSGSASMTFGSTINGAHDLSATAGTLSFGGAIGDITPLESLVLTSTNALTLPSITANSISAQTTGAAADITLPTGKALAASGSGNALTLKASESIIVNSGASLATSGGNIILWSNAANSNAGNIQMTGAAIATNGGNITLAGGLDNGANSGTAGDGIPDNFAWGYGTTANNNVHGVYINGGSIDSGTGNLTMRGKGDNGYAAGSWIHGIKVEGGALLQTTSGSISLTGTGGNGTANNMGVLIWGAGSAAKVASSTGSIAIVGTGGSVSGAGVFICSSGEVSSTGSGSSAASISITGTGGGTGSGIEFQQGGIVSTKDGAVSLVGTGGSASGIGISMTYRGGSLYSTGSGNLLLNGSGTGGASDISFGTIEAGYSHIIGGGSDSGSIALVANNIVEPATGTLTIQTTGSITIMPRTAGTTMGIGTGAGALSITETLLSDLSVGSYVFGSTATGLLTVNTAKDFGASSVSFISGSSINLAGSLSKTSGTGAVDYLFQADDDITNANSAGISATSGMINLTLQSNYDNDGGAIYLSGGNIATNGGNVTLGGGSSTISAGSGYAVGDAAYGDGITISGSINAGAGNIVINGQGGTEGSSTLNGIYLTTGTIQTTSGDITLNGRGGSNSLSTQRVGVHIQDNITTDSGDIIITGVGGSGPGSSRIGVFLPGGGHITSTGLESGNGAGQIVLEGTGAFAGVGIRGGTISTADADVQITGTGSGSNAYGIDFFNNSSSIASTGSGNINLTGIGTDAQEDIAFGSNAVGNQTYTIGGGVDTGAISITAGHSGKINFASMTTYSATLNMRTSGEISISGLFDNSAANALTSIAATAGNFTLTAPWGSLVPLTSVSLTSTASISLPSISVGTTGTLFVRTTGPNANITIPTNTTLSASSSGTPMTLVASGNFINESTTPFSVTAGARWLVYSSAISDTALNGLAPDFIRYSCTYGASCPALGAGNGVLYAETPVLTVVPSSLSVVYGDAAPSLSGYAYMLSGYLENDASHDTVAGTLGGATTYTQGSEVGSYNISHSSGTLSSSMGYGFAYATNASGIAVAPKTIIASLTGQISKVYDGTTTATPSSSNFNVSGLYGSDTVMITATSGIFASKNIGQNIQVTVDGLTLSGAKASNYALSSTTLSDNIGVITSATLTLTPRTAYAIYSGSALNTEAWSQSRQNFSYEGLMGSDTASNIGLSFTGSMAFNASTTTVVRNLGSYALTAGTLSVSDARGNYTFIFSNPDQNTYNIVQFPSTFMGESSRLTLPPDVVDKTSIPLFSGTQTASRTLANADLTLSPALLNQLGFRHQSSPAQIEGDFYIWQ